MTKEEIMASVETNRPELKPSQLSLSIPVIVRLSKKMKAGIKFSDWESVVFDDNDWDDDHKIWRLNRIDAHFNNIPLEQLLKILN